MRKEGKISKVAFCPKCDNMILACHVDYLESETEKEFTEFSNEGYSIKIETGDETRARTFESCNCIKL